MESEDLYIYGLKFLNVTEDLRNKIITFNFRFALMKLMNDLGKPFYTPISFTYDLLKGVLIRRKSERINVKMPGFIMIEGKFIPFATEDISDSGMRIITYVKLPENLTKISFVMNKKEYPKSGVIVWSEEINFYGIKAYRYGLRLEGVLVTSLEKDQLITAVRSML